MAVASLKAGRRDRRIAFVRKQAGVDGRGHATVGEAWVIIGTKLWASAYFGSGEEQRDAAQDGGRQKASFDVLNSATTRSLKVTDRLCYPVSDVEPDNWPAWDIRGIAPMGSEGFRITVEATV
jgi:head-tail adaptor